MDLQIINDLFESRMFNSRNSMKQYTAEDVENMAFLNFLAIQILKSEFDTAEFATDYLFQTFKMGNFKTLRGNASDLFWLMHILENKDASMLKDHLGNDIELKKVNFNDSSIKTWVRSVIKGSSTESLDRRFLISLEKMFNIRNNDYKNVRLLASEWTSLTDEQRQLTMTRLLFAFRKRMPRSELLPHLDALAKHKKLEIAGANNPEEENKEPTKNSLVKKLAVAAAVGAAVGLPMLAAKHRYDIFKNKIDNISPNKLHENTAASSISSASIASVVQPMTIISRAKRGIRKKKITENRVFNQDQMTKEINQLSNGNEDVFKFLFNLIKKEKNVFQQVTKLPASATEWDKKDANAGTLVRFAANQDEKNKMKHVADWLLDLINQNKKLDEYRGIQTLDLANKKADEYFASKNKKIEINTGIEETGTEVVLQFNNGYSIKKLKSADSLNREGKLMGHCVGSYANQVKSGALEIYSLRDEKNLPHCTLELRKKNIMQIKGKENKAPVEKYWPYIQEFIKKFELNIEEDYKNIGLIKINKKLISIQEFMKMDNLSVDGNLYLDRPPSLTSLPNNLSVGGYLNLGGCTSLTSLPNNLSVGGSLNLYGCTSLTSLPNNLSVGGYLNLGGCKSLTSLPNNLSVGGYLNLSGCTSLTSLPNNLSVGGSLNLYGCTSLTSLPNNLSVGGYLNLSGCKSLTSLPNNLSVGGYLNLSGCTSLTSLPNNLSVGGDLELWDCTSLKSLPDDLKVKGKIFISKSMIKKMNKKFPNKIEIVGQ